MASVSLVRLARFDDSGAAMVDRAEEVSVGVGNGGEILWLMHSIPESRPGANTTEAEATHL